MFLFTMGYGRQAHPVSPLLPSVLLNRKVESNNVQFKMVDWMHDIDSIRFQTFSSVWDTNGVRWPPPGALPRADLPR